MIITTPMMDNAPGVSRQWSALPVLTVPMFSLTSNVTQVSCWQSKQSEQSLGGMWAMFTIQRLIAD